MKDQSVLNELYEKYSTGVLNRKEFEGRIFQHILDNYRQYRMYKWTREECSDFLSWLYPRLNRAIDMYRDTGASFDTYVSSVVHWSSRNYRSRLAVHHATEYSYWRAQAEEMAVHNHEPEYAEKEPTPVIRISNPRQVLMLLLKSYYFVSDDFLRRIAALIEIEEEELRRLIGELRILCTKQEEEVRGLQERVLLQYYRCISFEKRLSSAPEDSVLHGIMQERLVRAKTRLASMKRRLKKLHLDPSNRQIAEILRIPKGTVDSALHAVKKTWIRHKKETP